MSRAREVGDLGSVTTVSSGNVGIGTSSPTGTLTVYKDVNSTTVPTAQSDYSIVVQVNGDVSGDYVGGIAFGDSAVSTAQAAILAVDSGTSATTSLAFATGSTAGIAERMRIDSSGNVGIGTTSPIAPLSIQSNGDARSIRVIGRSDDYAEIDFVENDDTTVKARLQSYASGFNIRAYSVPMNFQQGNTTKMTLDSSGNLLVGTTTSRGRITVQYDTNSSANPTVYFGNDGGTGVFASFGNASGTVIGTITRSGSSTSYNTTSDYRLKENVTTLDGAADRLAQIPVHRFNFIADPDTTVDGFLAHEVQAIVPEAVHGEKDGMREEEYEVTPAVEATYDEEGNLLTEAVPAVMGTRTVPDYQGIDQSKLVPLLTAALQEALQKIDALEARIATLEGGA